MCPAEKTPSSVIPFVFLVPFVAFSFPEFLEKEQPGRCSEFPPESSKIGTAGLQPQTGFR
jgi:hypothetical protein